MVRRLVMVLSTRKLKRCYWKKINCLKYKVPAAVPAEAKIAVEIRNRRVPARLVPLPFYKRPRK